MRGAVEWATKFSVVIYTMLAAVTATTATLIRHRQQSGAVAASSKNEMETHAA